MKYLFTSLYPLLVILMIFLTPREAALLHDANTYYNSALVFSKQPIHLLVGSWEPSFIDRGYPNLLALIIKITGIDDVIMFQFVNYLIWACVALCLHKTFDFLKLKHAGLLSFAILYSPLFLSFSAKLYSEPYAALGVALLITSSVIGRVVYGAIGTYILLTTKSIFAPAIVIGIVYALYKSKRNFAVGLIVGMVLALPLIISSYTGSRSIYNRAIQATKSSGSYSDIVSCIPYYVSYPLGLKLLPQYEGVCHQNDPSPTMPGYERNPYVIANSLREKGYTSQDWLSTIIGNPLKYLLVMIVSLFNFLLVEGLYPSVLIQLPFVVMLLLFIFTRISLSLYIWNRAFIAMKNNYWHALPIIYFFIVISQFQVEPRYIYPLIPYLYYLVGISHNQKV